jgi:hypothetical protein
MQLKHQDEGLMKALPIITGAVAITAACIGFATASKANVTWNVAGTFDDGGMVSGHFTIDQYGFLLNNFSLTTTAGTLPGFTYNASDSYFSNGTFYVDFQPHYDADLHLTFADSLLVASSANPLMGGSPGPSWECAGSFSCYVPSGGTTRYISSGSAVGTVPEPPTWAMLMLGFAAFGLVGYRSARLRLALAE